MTRKPPFIPPECFPQVNSMADLALPSMTKLECFPKTGAIWLTRRWYSTDPSDNDQTTW
jgi:hypothetical protein